MDGRPHLFHNLPLRSRFFILPAWWQRHKGVNNLPKVVASAVSDGSRTCDLSIASTTLRSSCSATSSPQCKPKKHSDVFVTYLPKSNLNAFHLTRTVFLHYRVKRSIRVLQVNGKWHSLHTIAMLWFFYKK